MPSKAASQQISPGMIISMNKDLYRVESSVKVTVTKGSSFVKTTLKSITTNKVIEKNFKPGQEVNEVTLSEKELEFMYPEDKDFYFLDINTLDQVTVPYKIIREKSEFLKEGVQLKASFYGDMIFSIELPQFLELMIQKIEDDENDSLLVSNQGKTGVLETGAHVEVPLFIEAGDIIKVDTKTKEFIQRV
jgi:elongation factor P